MSGADQGDLREQEGLESLGEPGPVQRKQQPLGSNTLVPGRNLDPVLADDLALK